LSTLRSWYASGRWTFALRLGAVGGVAGVAAWLLALVLFSLLGVERPTALALILAVARGALFGGLLALALALYWDRKSSRGGAGSP
jgi:hypothetical protein